MKTILTTCCLIISLSGCKTGKQAASFKSSQQLIDTLALLTPHVFVESANKISSSSDEELAAKLSGKISGITTSTLKKKYRLEDEPFKLKPSYHAEIVAFFNGLDTLKSGLNDIQLPGWLKTDRSGNGNRYLLATFVYGYYNSDFKPNYVMKQSLLTNTLILGRTGLNWVSIKILLADREANKVLFYNADNSYQSDPRILTSVEIMVKKLIQPIYYK